MSKPWFLSSFPSLPYASCVVGLLLYQRVTGTFRQNSLSSRKLLSYYISHLSFLLLLFCHVSVERPHDNEASFTVFLYLSYLRILVELIDKPADQCWISWTDRLKKLKIFVFLAFLSLIHSIGENFDLKMLIIILYGIDYS